MTTAEREKLQLGLKILDERLSEIAKEKTSDSLTIQMLFQLICEEQTNRLYYRLIQEAMNTGVGQ